MAISAQQLTIYLYSAHRAVIFAIAQLSCYPCSCWCYGFQTPSTDTRAICDDVTLSPYTSTPLRSSFSCARLMPYSAFILISNLRSCFSTDLLFRPRYFVYSRLHKSIRDGRCGDDILADMTNHRIRPTQLQ